MNKITNTSNLERYMKEVFEIELNIYIQEQLLQRMINTYNSLGHKKTIPMPSRKTSDVSITDFMIIIGIICGVISAIVALIVAYINGRGFGRIINSIWTGLVIGVIGAVIGALTIGLILGICGKVSDNASLEKEYEKKYAKYEQELQRDQNRVKTENIKKQRLSGEINLIRQRINESTRNLDQMYS